MSIAIDRDALVRAATEARERAYAPYSKFRVGAALLCADGTIVPGCNVENASYGLTICAERNAVFRAVQEGRTDFLAIAIALDSPGECTPCGACRQVLYEFAPRLEIIMANIADGRVDILPLNELLPRAFGPRSL
jgi:cytidine deaminase